MPTRARGAAAGCCASRTSTCRARSPTPSATSSPRSRAMASPGTSRSCGNRSAAHATPRHSHALIERGLAYPCACSRRDVQAAPVGAGGEHVYAGTCRDGIPPSRAARSERAWRDSRRQCRHRVRRPPARRAGTGSRARRRRLRDQARRRTVRVSARSRRRRRRAVDHRHRARRRPARVDAAADPPAAIARSPATVVPARAGRARRRRREAVEADARHGAAATIRCLRSPPHGRFLDQPMPVSAPRSVAEFWDFARACLDTAPPAAGADAARARRRIIARSFRTFRPASRGGIIP